MQPSDYLKNISVLYVEDEMLTMTFVSKAISSWVKNFYTAGDGQEGLRKYIAYRPDIVVTDIVMPLMDGIEMIKAIRAEASDVPVIITTYLDDTDYLKKAIEARVDRYVLKPVNTRELLDTIRSCAEIVFRNRDLNQQRQLNDLMLDSLPFPTMLIRQDTRTILSMNSFAEELGFSRGQACTEPFFPVRVFDLLLYPFLRDILVTGQSDYVFDLEKSPFIRIPELKAFKRIWEITLAPAPGNMIFFFAIDITTQKNAEDLLRTGYAELEKQVAARTAELRKMNEQLTQEINERRQMEASLRKREKELEAQSYHLQEVNTALGVLLKKRETDKKELEENVLINVRRLVFPYLEKLKKNLSDAKQETLISIMESNLNDIISPFANQFSSKYLNFTPMEIRIANLIKEGRKNKEIAELLNSSVGTILTHRHHIRKKLGLKKKKINLRTYLLSLSQE